jgi:hypothetical protein
VAAALGSVATVKRTVFGVLVGVAYAWWATGIAPFTALSYVLVAAPVTALVASYTAMGALAPHRGDIGHRYRRCAGDASLKNAAAWLAVLVGAAALESLGLALGGRSRSVPTLSTMVDHLLVTHVGRWLLFVAWLWVGATALLRLGQRPRDGAS